MKKTVQLTSGEKQDVILPQYLGYRAGRKILRELNAKYTSEGDGRNGKVQVDDLGAYMDEMIDTVLEEVLPSSVDKDMLTYESAVEVAKPYVEQVRGAKKKGRNGEGA